MPDIFTSSNSSNLNDSAVTKKEEPLLPQKTPVPPTFPNRSQLFSTFTYMPVNTHFETQEPNETILLLLRRHWVTNVPWLFTAFILILVPLFLFPLLNLPAILPSFAPKSLITFIILIWYLLTFSFILTQFILWYFNVSIVTNERIIDIYLFNLLEKQLAETRIAEVEDVSEKTGGFIRSFFDFGDVVVQTAAKESVFQFDAVPHPAQVVKTINQLMGNEEEGRREP